ncbi:NapC/NirT family cytochrome c [Neobacillus cucumis]|uniref:cytochrome c3 family protein n=1 Tax=Neobacillus cucumis TaxID=1740721 RepID=UPI0018DFE921|nr:NapC/NirT family cytochrome c [Neobacillus cucumis]MBI0577696.1 NapC/NirT family cytochrome c [Neobacillus cucumis]
MKEEHKELPAPARSRYKLFKIMTISLFFIILFFSIGAVGVETTSSSSFCKTCHEMKPEYYTWKVSTHNEVDCANCHIGSGVKNYAKAKANGLVQLYEKTTNTYTAPIQMPKEIPNSACEKCHNMDTRQVTPSGDLIIPHDKHLNKDIKCVQCHSGVAHGKVSERNVTFKSDYDKWDTTLGKSMMKNIKFRSPKMEDCIECHEARDVSTECKTCHTSTMLPKSHKQTSFKTENHGKLAEKDVRKCNSCHQFMSEEEIKDLQDLPASQQFLSTGTVQHKSVTAQEYAKENTFCKKCHTTRPKSHGKGFITIHGQIANQNKEKCLTCHDYQKTGFNKTSNVTCNSCHPPSHEGKNFREGHPIDLSGVKKPSDRCYTCHYKPKCTSCHKQ